MSTMALDSQKTGRVILKLGIPSIMAQLVSLLYSIVDRIYISRISGCGTLALAGLGLTVPVLTIMYSFANLIGMGGAPLAAIELGKNDSKKAGQYLWNCTVSVVVLAVVLGAFTLFFRNQVLVFFGADEETLPYALNYLVICMAGNVFSMLTLVLNVFLTTQGANRRAMIFVCTGAVLNIVLDPFFIFTLNLGISGAAIATVISQFVTTLLSLIFLLSKKTKIKLVPCKIEGYIISRILKLGFATFFMGITESLINSVYNKQLLRYGSNEYVALLSIVFSISQMISLPMNGLAQGAQPVISFNYGAGNKKQLKNAVKWCIILCTSYSVIATVVILIMPGTLVRIFTNEDKIVLLGMNAVRLFVFGRFVFGIQIGIQTTFRAMGNALRPTLVAIIRKVILIVPLAYILPLFIKPGTSGVFVAESVADLISVCMAVIIFLPFAKKNGLIGNENN